MCEELGICNNDTMPTIQKLTVEARGVNATALEKDIGTVGHLLNVYSCVLFGLLRQRSQGNPLVHVRANLLCC